jgi:hypothetical protein
VKLNTIYMKARLVLFLIFTSTLGVLLTNGKSDLFLAQEILILGKTITLNSEIIISLIILCTLICVLLLGIVDRLIFFRKGKIKERIKE